MGALTDIAAGLYRDRPLSTLYHYTSLEGMMGVVQEQVLWASEIRYLNDAAELGHFAVLLNNVIALRLSDGPSTVLTQFREWLSDRLTNGHMVFVGCFTEKGNLLSQWRGYCPPAQGVSLGFNPDDVLKCASQKQFRIGRCVYARNIKMQIANTVLDAVEKRALIAGESPASLRHPSQSYYSLFYELENDILSIAALIKDDAFFEETEWRAVSEPVANYGTAAIRYRTGRTTLIPFVNLPLPEQSDRLAVVHTIVGPTPTLNLSQDAVVRFLTRFAVCPKISASMIPYRPC